VPKITIVNSCPSLDHMDTSMHDEEDRCTELHNK